MIMLSYFQYVFLGTHLCLFFLQLTFIWTYMCYKHGDISIETCSIV